MAIKIKASDKANAVIFQGSTFPVYFNGMLSASIATGSLIDIENTAASSGSNKSYEYYNYDIDNFTKSDGSSFSTAAEAVTYINELANKPAVYDNIQGYIGLLSGYYFDGSATQTVIPLEDVDTWLDVPLTIHPSGTFDYRPQSMVDAQPTAFDTGSNKFYLEGLDISAFASFRTSLSYDPDEDNGILEGRLFFDRHTGTVPSSSFEIADTIMTMPEGAGIDYEAEELITFFVGDSIDTNGVGDAGKFKFQIKTDVPGTLSVRAFTLYINK